MPVISAKQEQRNQSACWGCGDVAPAGWGWHGCVSQTSLLQVAGPSRWVTSGPRVTSLQVRELGLFIQDFYWTTVAGPPLPQPGQSSASNSTSNSTKLFSRIIQEVLAALIRFTGCLYFCRDELVRYFYCLYITITKCWAQTDRLLKASLSALAVPTPDQIPFSLIFYTLGSSLLVSFPRNLTSNFFWTQNQSFKGNCLLHLSANPHTTSLPCWCLFFWN